MFETGIFTALGLGAGILFSVFIFWTIVWKGYALWIAAREKSKWWFVSMLLLNTVGILEILYIFVFSNWGKQKRLDRIEKRSTKN